MNEIAQARALRLQLYVACSQCAHLIDLDEGSRPQREVEAEDVIRHTVEEHVYWLEMPVPPAVYVQRPRSGESYL
jgi:hypothetical protein